jgi:hypothetical protein
MTTQPPEGSRRHVQGPSSLELNLADQLKETYIFERRIFEANRDDKESNYMPAKKYDGNVNPFDKDLEDSSRNLEDPQVISVWLKKARILHQQSIDPIDYVRRIFSFTGATPITPLQLTGDRARRLYERSLKGLRTEIIRAFKTQRELAELKISLKQKLGGQSMKQATLEVLYDRGYELSALFRYCLALSMKHDSFNKLIAIYEVDAAVQYIRAKKEYDEVWEGWIPEGFDEKSQEIYRMYLKG